MPVELKEMAWEARSKALRSLIQRMNKVLIGKKTEEQKPKDEDEGEDLVSLVLGKMKE